MTLNLTPADRAIWAAYEAANARAAAQYRMLPIAHQRVATSDACHSCGRPTAAIGRVCRGCKAGERES